MTETKYIVKDADGNTVKLPLKFHKVEVKTMIERRKEALNEFMTESGKADWWRGLNRRFREDDKERLAKGITG